MISKIEITSELEVLTGMHIGGTNEFAAIGAIDSPVVRDVISRLPMIPGSTLKGKMRTLMSRQYSENYMPVEVKMKAVGLLVMELQLHTQRKVQTSLLQEEINRNLPMPKRNSRDYTISKFYQSKPM